MAAMTTQTEAERPYTVARYIVDRLYALGVRHLFQVPGNYSAQFLLEAQQSGKIDCIGTTNELEAGYAADAYARTWGLGVACTTYGVGSFSLYNAIAGSYVERCPVVLINGTANAFAAEELLRFGVLFAHAIDTIRTDESIFRHVTAATAVITDPADAPRLIDRTLRACITEKKPVYLEVRDGVWASPCDLPTSPGPNGVLSPFALDDEREAVVARSVDVAVARVLDRLRSAKSPVLWGGEELQRYAGLQDLFAELVDLTGLPYSTTLMGKSLLAEVDPEYPGQRREKFIGVYDSGFAPKEVKFVIEQSDCVLALGTILSDFYRDIHRKTEGTGALILAAGQAVQVDREAYPNTPLPRFLPRLVETLRSQKTLAGVDHTPPQGFEVLKKVPLAEPTQGQRRALKHEAPEGDSSGLGWAEAFATIQRHVNVSTFVLADTSLCLFPAAQLLMPKRDSFIAQSAWFSIGYTLGAVVGVCSRLAEGERALVLIGDGGFQMIAQAFSTLVKLNKPATIVVFDNNVYGVEQFLVVTATKKEDLDYYRHGSTKPAIFFNQLGMGADAGTGVHRRWDYVKLAEAFGGRGVSVDTVDDFDKALATGGGLEGPLLIAVRTDARDVPPELEFLVHPKSAVEKLSGNETDGKAVSPFAAIAFD